MRRKTVLTALTVVLLVGAACGWSPRFVSAQESTQDRQLEQFVQTVVNAHELYVARPDVNTDFQQAFQRCNPPPRATYRTLC